MATDVLLSVLDGMTIALAFGTAAFLLHITAYSWYFIEILRGATRPNSATWAMFLMGAAVEAYTYHAIGEHWSASALPIACLVGVCVIMLTTAFMQFRHWLKGGAGSVYEAADPREYWLVAPDLGALTIYVVTGGAFWANLVAVSTSIFSFIPTWKTTLKNGYERPGPWLVWCAAYYAMWLAVLAEADSDTFWEMSFYPLYYLLLHGITALLAFKKVRRHINRMRDTGFLRSRCRRPQPAE